MAEIEFTAEVFEWRGPAPYYFLRVPADGSRRLRALIRSVSYGWGMIPVTARIGEVEWTTSLWPKDGRYLLPLKDAARVPLGAVVGDVLTAVVRTKGEEPATPDRAGLVDLVGRIMRGDAVSEEQEESWLAEFAGAVPHPRAIDLVLYPEVELGEDASPDQVVDAALRYRAGRPLDSRG